MTLQRGLGRLIVPILLLGLMSAVPGAALAAQPDTLSGTAQAGGEANLVVPDLSTVDFLGGVVNGRSLLMGGLVVCALGLLFGIYAVVDGGRVARGDQGILRGLGGRVNHLI